MALLSQIFAGKAKKNGTDLNGRCRQVNGVEI